VRFQVINRRIIPANPEEILVRAQASFGAEVSQDLRDAVAVKIEELRHYDVLAIDRAVALCAWGRSGSVLLGSYLDGHDDVLMLPELTGRNLYNFFELYQSLSLRDKLIAYPVSENLFEGNFAISSTQYYSAVQAILESYAGSPPDFLESRRAFVVFLHIAYNLALGRRPASSRPLIVYPQHEWHRLTARHFVEDFPQAKFIHTIRDPITLCDRLADVWLAETARLPPPEPFRDSNKTGPIPKEPSITVAPWWVASYQQFKDLLRRQRFHVLRLINKDRPHVGLESRTRAIRFEDLHADTAEAMRDLAGWLGLSDQPTLRDSTFNGIPYVVTRHGKAWSGRRLEQVQRHSQNLSRKDRALLFAFFYENFVAWNYPCPKTFGNPMVRCIVFVLLVLLPMKMEIMVARAAFKRTILPAVRHGHFSIAINSLLGILSYRGLAILLLVLDFFRRCAYRKTLLEVDHKRRPLEWRDDGLRVAPNETRL
jgi:hypothetical protein